MPPKKESNEMLSYFIALNWDIKKHYGLPSQQKRKIYPSKEFHPHFSTWFIVSLFLTLESRNEYPTEKGFKLVRFATFKTMYFRFCSFHLAVCGSNGFAAWTKTLVLLKWERKTAKHNLGIPELRVHCWFISFLSASCFLYYSW